MTQGYMSVRTAAEAAGVSVTRIYALIEEGRICHKREFGVLLVKGVSLAAWMRNKKHGRPKNPPAPRPRGRPRKNLE